MAVNEKILDMAADYNTKINFHYSSRDMIYEKDIYPPLLELIKESNGEMLFVDSDDKRFSKKELERMMQEILLIHDSLSFVVDEITFAANKRTPRLYSLI